MTDTGQKKSTRWLVIGLVGGVALLCGGGYVALRKIPIIADIPDASGALEANAARAKAAGVPFIAADLKPDPPVRDSENAAPLLSEIFEKFGDDLSSSEEPASKSVSAVVVEAVKNGDLAQARKVLANCQEMLALAERAAALPRCHFERDWDMGPNLLFPELAKSKNLARLFASRAEFKALDGDHRGAIQDISTAAKLGKHAGSDPTIISLLVHVAIEAISQRAVETSLGFAEKPEDVKLYIDYLESHKPNFDLRRALDGEAYMGIAIFRNRQLYGGLKDMGSGEPSPVPIDPSKLKRDGLPSKMMDRAFLSRHLELWTEVYEEGQSQANPSTAMFTELEKMSAKVDSTNMPSYLMAKILFPVFSQSAQSTVRGENNQKMNLSLARVVLYRKQHGTYPKTLAEAGGIEMDLFDGKPLKYILKESQVKVYSVGRDKVDDGGKSRSEANRGSGETFDEVAVYPSAQAQQLKSPVVPVKRTPRMRNTNPKAAAKR